jgi:hypothetical protein
MELDHIVPLALFDLTDRAQFLKACHFSNYQPLWAVGNNSKGTLYNGRYHYARPKKAA